jgi:hypothetical protein
MSEHTTRLRAIARELTATADALEGRAARPAATSSSGGALAPNFGRNAGRPLAELSVDDLRWFERALERDLADESKAKWHAKDQSQLADIRAEIESRVEQGG